MKLKTLKEPLNKVEAKNSETGFIWRIFEVLGLWTHGVLCQVGWLHIGA